MKNLIHPMFGIALLALVSIVNTGCPVGIAYPFATEDQVEKVDNKLIGTWRSISSEADILEVSISKKDDITYGIEVLEEGENFMADDNQFYGWATKLDGHNFLFSQGTGSGSDDYYLYHISFEGKKLVIQDVGLLVGGVDAVTSTESFRKEVSVSLKNPDCLTARFEYQKN